ncbi:hypothetical protein [Rathayibacter tritici]|uniref:Uncharacterized protein n=1 Tax=Rathayibacter tritici TaxID=33888 RepID=A0A160KUL6_9MICO|nr:hypothetical protein [Rathayibacter tritici]AND17297.1 hypothetical protein A6122_2174 [Rathayibacter tritici]PPI41614.1 hypothetical protein C5D18_14435 [Rathayibacter tritici]
MIVNEPYIWGDAEVTYPDWSGTAQLDQRRTGPQLEEIVGLDPDVWLILGIDIGGGETDHELHVVAVRVADLPDDGNVVPRLAAASGGEIPAVYILVHGADPYAVLKVVTHAFELHLRTRSTRAYQIRIGEFSNSYPGRD